MEEKKEEKNMNLKGMFGLKKGSISPSNLVILLMLGILLLILSWPSNTKEQNNINSKQNVEDANDTLKDKTSSNKSQTQVYVDDLEERLEEALRKVEGVGEVEVMITLKGSKEIVVLKDEPFKEERVNESDAEGGKRITSNHDKEENTVLVDNEDGSNTPYIIKELEPQVEGIVIIAQGGGNPEIINQINEATQVLFGVPTHKVKVMKMN